MAFLKSNNILLPSSTLFFITIPFLVSMINADTMMVNNVADFGAKADGKTDSSKAFLKAWDASCSSSKASTIYVPKKKYLIGPTIFLGPCKSSKITFRIDGILIAPDFKQMKSSVENWLKFDRVKGVSIIGGVLDGRGSSLYSCKLAKKSCPRGPTSLGIFSSDDVTVQNLSSLNPKMFHIVVLASKNILLDGVKIRAPEDSLNTDGIHVGKSTNVRVLNTGIKTGDDCISIGPGTENLWIERVTCGPGHGISIGSLGMGLEEEGVQNVTVKDVEFTGTQNGVRIKSWGRPSKGFVKGVVFKHAVMNNVHNPIVIDQNYCPRNEGCPGQHSGVQISDVTFANIKGTSASQVAMKFDCSDINPCKGIHVENIKLVYRLPQKQGEQQKPKPTESYCRNVKGITLGSVFPLLTC
ncbi:hypothetical protein MKW92_008812 [Papaver armeniacum]|nr:hypothetical protein MKW92_008812 [Papaver armeniacum]